MRSPDLPDRRRYGIGLIGRVLGLVRCFSFCFRQLVDTLFLHNRTLFLVLPANPVLWRNRMRQSLNATKLSVDPNPSAGSGGDFTSGTKALSDPLMVTISNASLRTGWSRSELYRLLAAGKIAARKSGKRTLLIWASIKAHAETLPPATFSQSGRRLNRNRPERGSTRSGGSCNRRRSRAILHGRRVGSSAARGRGPRHEHHQYCPNFV